MSDFCRGCRFDPKTTCPITPMYWAFLSRHEHALTGHARMAMPLRSLAKRTPARRAIDAEVFDSVSRAPQAGQPVEEGSTA
jgi:deoxyribodipyrimidine photolyase-related protein